VRWCVSASAQPSGRVTVDGTRCACAGRAHLTRSSADWSERHDLRRCRHEPAPPYVWTGRARVGPSRHAQTDASGGALRLPLSSASVVFHYREFKSFDSNEFRHFSFGMSGTVLHSGANEHNPRFRRAGAASGAIT
jgi:hypothetical protein